MRRALSCSAESRRARRCVRPLSSRAAPAACSPGQRLPPSSSSRRDNARREQFERRERERIEEAQRRLEEYWKREHEKVERWGREGSEPKTRFQKAFRVFVKVLETFDKVNSHWDKHP